jgi:16S rRNA (cytidine1402-2'-O)-methyltransferase
MPGTLYLLPTQLGDSPWPTVLPAGCQTIACGLQHFIVENAKTARAALKWLNHPTPLRDIAIEQLPEPLTEPEIDRLLQPLQSEQNVGLMSEAGCPGVADPGALLIRRAHETGISVKPLVGPSSLLLALMASGLDGQRFAFHGYLPAREPERSKRIAELEKESRHKLQTQLFIETPYRNTALLDALLAACHMETLLSIASDLTLASESVTTRRIRDWRQLPRPNLDRRPTVFLLLSAS